MTSPLSREEDQLATALYTSQLEERAEWLTEVFERRPAALLHEGQLSTYSVGLVLEQAFGLSEDAAGIEAQQWLDVPTEAQIALMSPEEANDARVTQYERRRYNAELDEDELDEEE